MAKKILIAEDESIIALCLKSRIECHGFTVCRITRSGKDTIQKALSEKPDVLIVDIYLNDEIDGIDAVRTIHKSCFIPVIYMTASTDKRTYLKAQSTTMVKYLKKPYNEAELIDAINTA